MSVYATSVIYGIKFMQSEILLEIYELMVKSRMLEERLINMFKQNQGFFWIGGPGEEAFNIPLGMLVKKGQGLDYDYLHLHYRSSAILLAMGMDPFDAIRQMKNTALDPHSGGRNFSSHYSLRRWNVAPITSPIEVQYVIAIGTAIAQKKRVETPLPLLMVATLVPQRAILLPVWCGRRARETNYRFSSSSPIISGEFPRRRRRSTEKKISLIAQKPLISGTV